MEVLTGALPFLAYLGMAVLAVGGTAALGYVGGRALQAWLDHPRARRATWRED